MEFDAFFHGLRKDDYKVGIFPCAAQELCADRTIGTKRR
ncbi:MAG: hypothetical protein PWQ18_837 [Clostridia bacterium]|nr:hypothetical protein [Clostridia bacterium]